MRRHGSKVKVERHGRRSNRRTRVRSEKRSRSRIRTKRNRRSPKRRRVSRTKQRTQRKNNKRKNSKRRTRRGSRTRVRQQGAGPMFGVGNRVTTRVARDKGFVVEGEEIGRGVGGDFKALAGMEDLRYVAGRRWGLGPPTNRDGWKWNLGTKRVPRANINDWLHTGDFRIDGGHVSWGRDGSFEEWTIRDDENDASPPARRKNAAVIAAAAAAAAASGRRQVGDALVTIGDTSRVVDALGHRMLGLVPRGSGDKYEVSTEEQLLAELEELVGELERAEIDVKEIKRDIDTIKVTTSSRARRRSMSATGTDNDILEANDKVKELETLIEQKKEEIRAERGDKAEP